MRQPITKVLVSITTRCNRHCPDCCYGMTRPEQDKHDHTLEYLEDAGRRLGLGPGDTVAITGGEPTLHPKFQEWAPRFRSIFGAGMTMIESNAYGFKRFPEAFLNFDYVHASYYDGSFGGHDNMAEILWMDAYMKEHSVKFEWYFIPHVPRNTDKSDRCQRGDFESVIYFDGKLYGCCAASGQPNKVGCDITPTWRDDVVNLPLPCKGCPFAT